MWHPYTPRMAINLGTGHITAGLRGAAAEALILASVF